MDQGDKGLAASLAAVVVILLMTIIYLIVQVGGLKSQVLIMEERVQSVKMEVNSIWEYIGELDRNRCRCGK